MNDTAVTRFLDRLAQTFPDEPAPVHSLLEASRGAQRTKTRRTIAGAVVAVALVLGGGAVVQQAMDGGDSEPTPDTVAEPPTVPDGTRQVGVGRAVVSVPVDWPIVTATCGTPKGDHVVWVSDARAVARCNSFQTPPGVQVGITTLDSVAAREWVLRLSPEEASAEILDHGPMCAFGSDYCTHSFGVRSENAFFLVTVKQTDAEAALTPIRDSLQLLPDGFTTVPFIEPGTLASVAEDALGEAGFDPYLNTPYLGDMDVPVNGTEPVGGSVVQVGSTVTMLLSPGDQRGDEHDDAVATSNQAALDKGFSILSNGGVTNLGEAEPPHGATHAILSGTWGGHTVIATVRRSGDPMYEATVIERQTTADVEVQTVRGSYTFLRFPYGDFTVDLRVISDAGEFLRYESNQLTGAILCPSECGPR